VELYLHSPQYVFMAWCLVKPLWRHVMRLITAACCVASEFRVSLRLRIVLLLETPLTDHRPSTQFTRL